jgi:hypothetical protein
MKRFLIATLITTLALSPVFAGRPHYGGRRHAMSHGGYYKGGTGSSHKGGLYRNSRTGDHYGRHK